MLEHYIGYAFGGVFIVAGFFLVAVGGRMCKQAVASWKWPSAEGTVRGTRIDRRPGFGKIPRATFQPIITYEYCVDGRAHSSKRLRFAEVSSTENYALRVVGDYPVGKAVTVYYDPNTPEIAVLRRGLDGNALGVPALGFLFIVAGSTVLWFL